MHPGTDTILMMMGTQVQACIAHKKNDVHVLWYSAALWGLISDVPWHQLDTKDFGQVRCTNKRDVHIETTIFMTLAALWGLSENVPWDSTLNILDRCVAHIKKVFLIVAIIFTAFWCSKRLDGRYSQTWHLKLRARALHTKEETKTKSSWYACCCLYGWCAMASTQEACIALLDTWKRVLT